MLRSIAHVLSSLSLRAAADEVQCPRAGCLLRLLQVSALQSRLTDGDRGGMDSFDDIDTNGDGVIDRQEYLNALQANAAPVRGA